MKPDWKDAPDWAKYLARDDDGTWCWFANKPERGNNDWFDPLDGKYEESNVLLPNWRNSLERRSS